MKYRQLIIIVYLLVIIMSCIMTPVCAAENIPFAPTSNVYYPHLWYSSDPGIGGYLDPAKKYNQQFSPYASSTMNIKGILSLYSFTQYVMTTSRNLSASDKSSIESNYLRNLAGSTLLLDYKLAEGGVVNSLYIDADTISFSWANKDLSKNEYYFIIYQPFNLNINVDVPVGTFTFAQSQQSQNDFSFLRVNVDQCAGWIGHSLVKSLYLRSYGHYSFRDLCNLTYTFPTNVITDKLVFTFGLGIQSNNEDKLYSPKIHAYLDNYDLGIFTFEKFRGVIESNFDYALNSNSIHYVLKLVDSSQYYDVSGYPDEHFRYTFELGKVVPISTYDTFGGESYGTWQSKSCQPLDFVCHLGNGIGYLIYEFPLTSSITKLVAPIGEFFIKSFDFLEGFSSIGVAYGVIFTMIMISVIMFLIFGK